MDITTHPAEIGPRKAWGFDCWYVNRIEPLLATHMSIVNEIWYASAIRADQ